MPCAVSRLLLGAPCSRKLLRKAVFVELSPMLASNRARALGGWWMVAVQQATMQAGHRR